MNGNKSNFLSKDEVLTRLVDMVNEKETEIPITLSLNGFVVNGNLIGIKEYYYTIGKSSRIAKVQDKSPEEFAREMETLGDAHFKSVIDARTEREAKPAENITAGANFIHLKNARPGLADDTFPKEGQLWRYDIEAITGWSIDTE